MPVEQPIDPRDEADVMRAAVEYDGRTYDLEALLRQLPPHFLQEVEATVPRSGQELWDEVVRRWPGTAAEVVAGMVWI